jgi:alpha-L-rhamnosidase
VKEDLKLIFLRAQVMSLVLGSIMPWVANAQSPPPGQLDPSRVEEHPRLYSSFHTPLTEQYIWTHEEAKTAAKSDAAPVEHYFRVRFQLANLPAAATLYLAGLNTGNVYVNGMLASHLAADPMSPLRIHVFELAAAKFLRPGENVLALEVSNARFPRRLVVKLLAAGPDSPGPVLLSSGPQWKGTTNAPNGWEAADFDDAEWDEVATEGAIESNIDFFQGNYDDGLYDWTGYEGASPFLAQLYLPAVVVRDAYAGQGSFENLNALQSPPQEDPAQEFTVRLAGAEPLDEYVPGVTLDFGREVAGRIEVLSGSDSAATVSVQYGESLGELNNQPYLRVNLLHLSPHGAGHGPKSAFRYARVRFLAGGPVLRFRAIHLEDIYYPVHYLGSFESSDALLNRIWETGVYTSHLCMQDDIWDAPKRDRERWMGDLDVSGRVIDTVFADHFLMEDTLTRLIGNLPIERHVNRIPGYSSFWLTGLETYYLHTGRKEYLASMHDRIVQLLEFMDSDFNARNEFINHTNGWLFVDWSNELNGDTPEARTATVLEYVRAYRAGAWLLRQLDDTKNAEHFEERADQLTRSSRQADWTGDSYGARWQTNAMAVLAGVAEPGQYASIWQNVLSDAGKRTWRPEIITPYYAAYVLDAMAQMNRRPDALAWIREYWGGMIDEGATSFWEAYDPSWPKSNPHVDLQADNTAGYGISLAHGWSSGPAYWLTEQLLGIRPEAPGFSKVAIRPDLIGLSWARGTEPTPNGQIEVDLRDEHGLHAAIILPPGVEATVLFPITPGTTHVQVNGAARTGTATENGTRLAIVLHGAGHYELHAE